MKKRSGLFIVIPIIVCLIFTSFTTAQAAPLQNDPVITVISGGSALQTTIIPLEQLPGSSPTGEYQFSGDGIRVEGITGGSANLCLTVKAPATGWTNTIHRWTGSAWEEIATTTTVNEEGLYPKACATIYFDGTFAALMSYKEPADKKVLQECANIEFIYPDFDWTWGSDEITIIGGYVYPAIDEGSNVRYQLLNIKPNGTITGDLTAPGVVVENYFEPELGGLTSYVDFPSDPVLVSTVDWWDDNTFTVRFYFQNCYKDFDWPDDFITS